MPGPPFFITSVRDTNSNQTLFTYTVKNNVTLLTEITDPANRRVQFSYNDKSKITAITVLPDSPLTRTFTIGYEPGTRSFEIRTLTDADNKTLRYGYNTYHQLTTKTDRDGNVFVYGYNGTGLDAKPVSITAQGQGAVLHLENAANWSTSVESGETRYTASVTFKIDGNNQRWEYRYDDHGYITSMTAPDGATTTYIYDPATLKLRSETDANNHTTMYEYDARGNRTKVRDALGHETQYEYEPVFNNVTKITYPNGSITDYQYDANGNRTRETRDAGGLNLVTEWTYYTEAE